MGLYLGLDMGGTAGRWAWLDLDQVRERSGGSQAAVHGPARAAEAVAEVLGEVRKHRPGHAPELTVIGVAGAGDRSVAAEIEERLERLGVSWPVTVVGDLVVAAATALPDAPGVALWSGTGSFAVGRDRGGRLHRVGGRGYLLGDAGSAYDMVRRAGAAAVAALDGLGPQTALLEILVEAVSAPSSGQLGSVLQRWAPAQVAGCFLAVLGCGERGDEVALGVLQGGARQLARQASAAAVQSGLEPGATALAVGGGVLEKEGLLTGLLREELKAVGMDQAPRRVRGGGAFGAALLARAMDRSEEPMCRWAECRGPA